MLTLIKKEIEDNFSFLIASIVVSAVLSLLITASAFRNNIGEDYRFILPLLAFPVLVLIFIGVCSMGVSQMGTDRNSKVSAFLTTLPVSRSRIFAARVITGILTIIILLAAPFLTFQALMNDFGLSLPVYRYFISEITLTLFLLSLAIYSTGLMLGMSLNKIISMFGNIILSIFLLALVIIKGPGIEAQSILTVYIVCCLFYTWHGFNKMALI